MGRLSADFSAAFSRDLKKKAKRRNWDLSELQKLIDLVLENTPESIEISESSESCGSYTYLELR